jgi:hypothetical protein
MPCAPFRFRVSQEQPRASSPVSGDDVARPHETYLEVLRIRRASLGDDDPITLKTLRAVVKLAARADRLAEAEAHARARRTLMLRPPMTTRTARTAAKNCSSKVTRSVERRNERPPGARCCRSRTGLPRLLRERPRSGQATSHRAAETYRFRLSVPSAGVGPPLPSGDTAKIDHRRLR